MSEYLFSLLKFTIRMMGKRNYNINMYAALEQWNVNNFVAYYGRPQNEFLSSMLHRMIIDNKSFSIRSMMSTILTKDDGSTCLVFFIPKGTKASVSIETLQVFIDIMDNIVFNINDVFNNPLVKPIKISKGIIISTGEFTSSARILFGEARKTRVIQYFTDDDILIDPSIHIYNPEIQILSPIEKDNFLQTNNLETRKMAQNTDEEALAKYLGAEVGDIVEYQRVTFLPYTLVESEIFHRYMKRSVERKRLARRI